MSTTDHYPLSEFSAGELANPGATTPQLKGVARQLQFVAIWCGIILVAASWTTIAGWAGRANAHRNQIPTESTGSATQVAAAPASPTVLTATVAPTAPARSTGEAANVAPAQQQPPPVVEAPQPPLELPTIPELKGVDALPALLTLTGRHSVQDLIGTDIDALRPYLPETVDKSDTQPYIPSYIVKLPNVDRKASITFGFVDDKLLRVGAWVTMKAGDVSRLLRRYRKPDRQVEDTGTQIMTWNLGTLEFEVSVPPGDKPEVQWWLCSTGGYDAFVEQDRVTRSAFAQSDMAATLVDAGDPESLSKAATFYEKAVELVPAYSITWLRLCRVYQKLDQLDNARAACEKARDRSSHDAVIKAATKLLGGL